MQDQSADNKYCNNQPIAHNLKNNPPYQSSSESNDRAAIIFLMNYKRTLHFTQCILTLSHSDLVQPADKAAHDKAEYVLCDLNIPSMLFQLFPFRHSLLLISVISGMPVTRQRPCFFIIFYLTRLFNFSLHLSNCNLSANVV